VYSSEKMLKEAGDVATTEQKDKIQKGITELKDAISGGDVAAIKTKTESLQSAIYELSAAMYQKASQQQQQAEPSSGQTGQSSGQQSGPQGNYVDADYEVVNDKK